MQEQDYGSPWPLWQRIAFRFTFCYLSLYVLAWPFFANKPGLGFLNKVHGAILGGATNAFNNYVMHFEGPLRVPVNMNDSAYRLTQVVLFVCIAIIATLVWSIAGRRQKSYYKANYYFTTGLRYFIAFISFLYGTFKLFAIQMPSPTLAELTTPLGDLTPMTLSWHQIGYSAPYQFFLGVAEVTIGCLLLYRRTTTLGLFMALGVYVNVMFINYFYDVWVKIFSTHLVIICICLLIRDFKRLADFFIFDRPVTPRMGYAFTPGSKAARYARKALKGGFIAVVLITFADRLLRMDIPDNTIKPVPAGIYAVTAFVRNADTLPVLAHDSLMWKDFVFEAKGNLVTVNSADTIFKRFRTRGTFMYTADTLKKTMACYKYTNGKNRQLFTLNYTFIRPGEIELRTKVSGDSLYLKLVKSSHTYKLSERQFHWFSDYRK